MYLEDLSYFLFGASIIAFINNIRIYYINTKSPYHDSMGAMINWHYGFLFFWILLSIGMSFNPYFRWFHGVVLFLFIPLATFLFWYLIHLLLKLVPFFFNTK